MESTVDSIIRNFARFLNDSDAALKFTSNNLLSDHVEDIINDFYQVNWEILVESAVCIPGKEWLLVYGEGGDCNPESSRVTFFDKLPTHRIICKCKNDNTIIDQLSSKAIEIANYTFNSFATSLMKTAKTFSTVFCLNIIQKINIY